MPQSIHWYMDITEKIFEGIAPRINPEIGKFIEQTEGLEGPDIGFLQIGYAFSPKHLTTESYIERGPYSKPSSYETQMDEATQKGWLVKIDDGQYQVSEKGKKTVQRFLETGNKGGADPRTQLRQKCPDRETRKARTGTWNGLSSALLLFMPSTAFRLGFPRSGAY